MYISMPTDNFRQETMNNLCRRFSFLKKEIYGASLCGRPLEAYFIGNPQNLSLLCAGVHGCEYLTVLTLMNFTKDLCRTVESGGTAGGFYMGRFLSRRGVCIIPCVNPDGNEIAVCKNADIGKYRQLVDSITDKPQLWKANAAGVDLNHNFNAGWKELKQLEIASGITSPASTRYGGESPESEPESRCLANFCRSISLGKAFAFHSQGREIYCDFGDSTPKRSFEIAEILANSSGYTVSRPDAIATGGGFKDWIIEELKKPAMTIEIGLGENPLPLCDFEPEYNRIFEMLCFCCVL